MILRKAGWSVVLAAIVVIAAPGSEAAKLPRKNPFSLRAHVVDFETGEHPRARARGRRFAGYETHTIEFDVFQRGRPGVERPTQIKLYLPNGDLYGAFDVAAFTDESVRKRVRPAATARVPVSGTMITRYGLYGRWRAEVCWEVGTNESCRREMRFVIR